MTWGLDRVRQLGGSIWDGAAHAVEGVGNAAGHAYRAADHATHGALTGALDLSRAPQRALGSVVQLAQRTQTNAVHAVENAHAAVANGVAARADGIPILGSVARGAAAAQIQAVQAVGGFTQGVTGMAAGAINAGLDPVSAARGLGGLAYRASPLSTAVNVARGVSEGRSVGQIARREARARAGLASELILTPEGVDAMNHGRYGEAVGRSVANVGAMVVGAGEASAASRAGGAAAVGRVGEAAAVGRAGEAAAVGRAGEAAAVGRAGEAVAAATPAQRIAAEGGIASRGTMAMPPVDAAAIRTGRAPAGWGEQVRAAGGAPEGIGSASTYGHGPSVPPRRPNPSPSWPEPISLEQAAANNAEAQSVFAYREMNRRMSAARAQQEAAARAQQPANPHRGGDTGIAQANPNPHRGGDTGIAQANPNPHRGGDTGIAQANPNPHRGGDTGIAQANPNPHRGGDTGIAQANPNPHRGGDTGIAGP